MTGGKVNIGALFAFCVGSNFERRPTQRHVTALYVVFEMTEGHVGLRHGLKEKRKITDAALSDAFLLFLAEPLWKSWQ